MGGVLLPLPQMESVTNHLAKHQKLDLAQFEVGNGSGELVSLFFTFKLPLHFLINICIPVSLLFSDALDAFLELHLDFEITPRQAMILQHAPKLVAMLLKESDCGMTDFCPGQGPDVVKRLSLDFSGGRSFNQ